MCASLSYTLPAHTQTRNKRFEAVTYSNLDAIAARRALELDEIIVSSISSEERTCVLEVLHLGVALERLLHCLIVPVCAESSQLADRIGLCM